jgi:hypothetical protein
MAKNRIVTEEQFPEIAGEVVAIFSNTFVVSVSDQRIRLTFGEYIEGKTYYRSAISMPIEDAESLSADITNLLNRFRERTKT